MLPPPPGHAMLPCQEFILVSCRIIKSSEFDKNHTFVTIKIVAGQKIIHKPTE
jgi:hypothetical protein